MIVDGRELAFRILADVRTRTELVGPLKVVALAESKTSVVESYLRIKQRAAEAAGCVFEVRGYDANTEDADAVIVQLPTTEGTNAEALCNQISLEKDADVLSRAARVRFEKGEEGALLPPVVGAVQKILEQGEVRVAGKKAVVVGEGFLVGKPVATWLRQQGARVETVSLEAGSLDALKDADIIVSGAGSPHLIKPEMIREGVVLIDAGTSESGGKFVGDADPSCAEKGSLFTPVPGGVGPVAVACLFENVAQLAGR